MRVYMVNSGNNGCCYVRILLPAFANGYMSDKGSVRDESQDLKQIMADLVEADVVVFHRPERQEFIDLMKLLKADGKKIVIDNDDTFKIDDHHPLAEWTSNACKVELEDRDKYFDEAAGLSDLMTTTTEVLKAEYEKMHDNVIILPNCVDPMDWDKPLRNETKKVRIGLVGSVSYAYDYAHIKDTLKELSDRDDVELVLFGLGDMKHREKNPEVTKFFQGEYTFWDSLNIEQIQWCEIADYPTFLNEARLDMMLIPRRENYFNKCKSNIKVLEAAMCEVPCIAQSFEDSPYEEFKHARNILLVKDNNDWMLQIESLIRDKALRRKLGMMAKEYVLNNYNIEDKAHLWDDAYTKIYEKA